MERLPTLVELLLTNPTLSNRAVSERVGFSRRTVDRYARLVQGARWEELRELSAPELDGVLNRQFRKSVKRQPDIAAVEVALADPSETLLTQWHSYRYVDPRTAVGYSHFATLCRQRAANHCRRRKRVSQGGASC